MKIGLVGYQGSGKSTLFEWLTGIGADPSLAHTLQSAMATVHDSRVAQLCEIYKPKKITEAAIEIVDTPGLDRKHDGNASRLASIREAACLLQVVGAFDQADFQADLDGFEEDLLLADLEIVAGRVERLKDSVRKPRPNRDEQIAELAAIEPILETLEAGKPLSTMELSKEQIKVTRSFQLLTQKKRLALINVGDDETDLEPFRKHSTSERPVIAVPVGLELELERMDPEDRDEFRNEMGIASYDQNALIQQIMLASGQMLFFTAGEKEVRTWMIPQGATAVEAADSIHSDLARGFIRAETMTCEDLIRLGREREVKANSLMRQEPKDYVIQDGDILNIRFSV
jgi:ribosome-binding ATPase YchF (GTP1/OBG family)